MKLYNHLPLQSIVIFFVVLAMALSFPSPVSAWRADWCDQMKTSAVEGLGGKYESEELSELTVTVPVDSLDIDNEFKLKVFVNEIGLDLFGTLLEETVGQDSSNKEKLIFTLINPNTFKRIRSYTWSEKHNVYLYDKNNDHCDLGYFVISANSIFEYKCKELPIITQERTVNGQNKICSSSCLDMSGPITIELSNVVNTTNPEKLVTKTDDLSLRVNLGFEKKGMASELIQSVSSTDGKYAWVIDKSDLDSGTYGLGFSSIDKNGIIPLFNGDACYSPNLLKISASACKPETCGFIPKNQQSSSFELCNQIPDSETTAKQACRNCVADQDKVWTAVGCISKEPKDIIAQFITIGLGIGGGVALIMIIAGGFMLTISQGNPQKTNEAKEMITSAIIGLLFVIFSVVILQFIGVTIFRIPGFGEEATP